MGVGVQFDSLEVRPSDAGVRVRPDHVSRACRSLLWFVTVSAPISTLVAVGSCRVWSIELASFPDGNNITLRDLSPLYANLLSKDEVSAAPIPSATFGWWAWNPNDTECQWYESDFIHVPPTSFTVACVVALGSAVVSLLVLVHVGLEAVCCRWYGSRWLSLLLSVVASLTHGTTVALSRDCWLGSEHDPDVTCAHHPAGTWPVVALWLVTLVFLATTGKPRPVLRDWMEQRERDDPCCAMVCCCCRHYFRRRKLVRTSSGRGWQISFERPGDSIRWAEMEEGRPELSDSNNDGSSSDEEDTFFDVDRDFVGHEIVVEADDEADDTSCWQHLKPKPPPVLYPLKEPTVNATTRRADDVDTATTTTHQSSPRYKNGVVVDNDLFFDTVRG